MGCSLTRKMSSGPIRSLRGVQPLPNLAPKEVSSGIRIKIGVYPIEKMMLLEGIELSTSPLPRKDLNADLPSLAGVSQVLRQSVHHDAVHGSRHSTGRGRRAGVVDAPGKKDFA
jgi:hypothetical protein